MIIKKIYIRQFGALSDFTAELTEGINIFEGENESGKSTILAFIRFIFYGLPSKRTEEGLAERERALSWEGGIADGYIELSCDRGNFRIERRGIRADNRDGYLEKHAIIDLSTGSVVFKGETPGDLFFGVPASVFDSTASVRQQSLGNLDGGELGSSIENILFSADETVNTDRALTKLNTARRQLLLQRGNGGKIAELTAVRDTLRRRLETATEASKTVLALRATVDRSRTLCTDLRAKLNAADDRLHAYETIQTLKRFDMLHAGEAKISALKKEYDELMDEKGHDGKLPDREFVNELDSISRRLALAESEAAAAASELVRARAEQTGDTNLAARADDIERTGGPRAVAEKYAKMRSRVRARRTLGIIFLVLGLIIMGGSLGLYFAKIFSFLTLEISSAVTVGGLVLLIIGTALFPAASRAKRAAAVYLFELGIDENEKVTSELIIAHASACLEARDEIEMFAALTGKLEQSAAKKTQELEAVRREASLALARFGTEVSGRDTAQALADAGEDAAKTATRAEELLFDIAKYSASVKEAAARLEGEDEASLRAHLAPHAEAVLEGLNPTVLKQERDSYAARLDAARTKLLDSEKNLGIIEGTSENPNRLAAELEAAEEALDAAYRKYYAIVLAYESIEGAGEALRRSITPRLRTQAGTLMSELTGGRYTEFGIGEDFAVSLVTRSGTKGISSLSAGTRDTAYFALRSTLSAMLYPNDRPPMLLDEAFAQLDDGRASALLELISKLSESTQIVLFTCHGREAAMLASSGTPFCRITLTRKA